MSNVAGDTLQPALLERLSVKRAFEYADAAIIVCSVDDDGRPHPAMLSSLELVARDAENIRFVVHHRSTTARNLSSRGRVTLVLSDEEGTFYIKGDAQPIPARLTPAPELRAFNMRVTTVLEDNPAAYEQAAIVSGIRIRRGDVDEPKTRALLSELVSIS